MKNKLLRYAIGITLLSSIFSVLPVNAQNIATIQTIIAQSSTPESTTIKHKGEGELFAEIKDGEFSFVGVLKRSSGKIFIGEDSQVRVIYDKANSRITVINKQTGTEFYNYIFSTANEGSL